MVTQIPATSPKSKAVADTNALAKSLGESFPVFTSRFEDMYKAWKGSLPKDIIITSSDSKNHDTYKNPEYAALLQLGPTVVPLVVQKLTLPAESFAIHLYNDLESNSYMKVIQDHYDMYQQASLIIDLNAMRNEQFKVLTAAWEEYQNDPDAMFSANSWVYASGDAYDALVAMGPSIIPNIMLQYGTDEESQTGWWYLVLHYIVVPGRRPYQTISKITQFRRWKSWFDAGGDMESVSEHL